MEEKDIKRKIERKDFSGEAKIHLSGQGEEISVGIKDISISGLRVIIAGRIIEAGTPLQIKTCINGRNIQCKGKVAWSLPLRPGLGNIILFDTGIEFTEISPEDQSFLKQLPDGQLKDGNSI